MRKSSGLLPWLRERWLEAVLALAFAAMLAWYARLGYGFLPKPVAVPTASPPPGEFSGGAAYDHVLAQVAFGARPTGSEANRLTGDYIVRYLRESGWQVEEQVFTYRGVQARNIVGRAGKGPVVIVGAHYDTRLRADKDPSPDRGSEPVLGANDGASGTAVLLELARSLDRQRLEYEVWLVFFDAEDNGHLDGWDYIVGSTFFADNLAVTPEMVLIVDMVGDADQQIYKERSSTPALQDRIWEIAANLGYGDYFVPEYKWTVLDDHTPFLRRGFPAVDLIDFDYPYWHTTQDTADKVSAEALERVGRVLQALLEKR